MIKKKIFLIIPLILIIFVLGCGKREIDELALVSAVGIDKGEKSGNYRITAQIVRPSDARGQTGAPSGGTGEPIYSVSAEGDSIFAAIRNLSRFSSRRVFWAHNFVIVINEDVARGGIGEILDFFTRNHETRMNTWVVVTPDPASELVSTITGLEVVPGEAVDKIFRYNEIVAEAPRTNVMRLEESYLSESSHPVLAKMQLQDRGISNKKPEQFGSIKQIELSGTAVFNRDKMVGWLSPTESRGLLFFIENVDSAAIVLPCPNLQEESKNRITLELKSQKFKVTPQFQNGKPKFDISLTTYVDLVESGCAISLDQMKVEIEDLLEKKLKSQIEGVLEKAQKTYKVDFLKLGETFNNRYPAEWNELKKNWDEVFPQADTTVRVDTHVNSPVLLRLPTKSMKGGDE